MELRWYYDPTKVFKYKLQYRETAGCDWHDVRFTGGPDVPEVFSPEKPYCGCSVTCEGHTKASTVSKERVWCEHIFIDECDGDWVTKSFHWRDTDDFKFCPICGAPRPTDKPMDKDALAVPFLSWKLLSLCLRSELKDEASRH